MNCCEYVIEVIGIILDAIVAILTFCALRTAITANKQNKTEIQELRVATKQSLLMHEQSKNLQLMDLRLQILGEIEQYEAPKYLPDISPKKVEGTKCEVSINKLKLVFNDDPGISKTFKTLNEYYNSADRIIGEIMHYFRATLQEDGEGGWISSVWDEIMRYENLLGLLDCSDATEEEFKKFCSDNLHTESCSVDNQSVEYNYYTLTKELDSVLQLFKSTKESLISQMREFIDESIKPIK
ncbi:MAG: hypothetical protein IKL00_11145 [Oscillospiraceae bacterium]|nr:hypothetical protein [Oscillospiraceae bacterium]